MESKEVHGPDVLVDLEKGKCLLTKDGSCGTEVNSEPRTMQDRTWNGLLTPKNEHSHHMSCFSSHSRDSIAKNGVCMPSEGEVKVGLSDISTGDKEKKKWSKKPPRPPRPPTPSPLDPADQKLISELSELAALKRARIERIKTLRKIKNSKSTSSSFGNLVALIITVIFCFFILWQGLLMK